MQGDQAHLFLHYSQTLEKDSSRVDISGQEHHHLRRVLRSVRGDTVFVTNGRGVMVRGDVESIDDVKTVINVTEVVQQRTSTVPLTLALACLKKDAFEQAVKQCTELGMTRCLPFVAARSHLKEYSDTYLDRLRKIALSAMKQSFRSVLPSMDNVVAFDTVLHEAPEHRVTVVGAAGAPPLDPPHAGHPLLVVVGPEAGLTTDEVGRLEAAGCVLRSVSLHRLRSETAAAALTGALLQPVDHGRDDSV